MEITNDKSLSAIGGDAAYAQIEADVVTARHDRGTRFRRAASLYAAEGNTGAQQRALWDALALDLEPCRGEGLRKPLFSGSRFAPRVYFEKPDGETVCQPASEDFTPEVLGHLRQRATQTMNPFHRARFWDVVWEATRDHRAGRHAYQSYVDLVPVLLVNDWGLELVDALDRLKTLALQLNDRSLVDRAIEVHRTVFDQLRRSDRWRWFLEPIRSLLTSAPKLAGVQSLGLAALAEDASGHFRSAGNQILEREFLMTAAEAHRKAKDAPRAAAAQRKLAESFEREAKAALGSEGGGLLAVVALQHALRVYTELGTCPDKVREMKEHLKGAARRGESEAKRVTMPLGIPEGVASKLLDRIRPLSVSEANDELIRMTSLLPNYARAKDAAAEAARLYPMQNLFPIQIMRGANPVLVIAGNADKVDYHAIQSMIREVLALSMEVFHPAFEILKEKGANADVVRDDLARAGILSGDRLKLLHRGIERYLAGDWISALHILPIQLEGVIRDLAGLLGIPTTAKKPDGMHDRLLSDLLLEPALAGALGSDFTVLLSAALTDQRGLNLRNDVAHALLGLKAFQPWLCAMLLIFLLRLSAYRLVAAEEALEGT